MGGFLSPLGLSFAKQVAASRTFYPFVKRVADKYAHICGYRQHGLKYDDLLCEENTTVQTALKRLTPREEYDRAYRIRLATQLSVLHQGLPAEQSLPAEQDQRYLTPLIEEVVASEDERKLLDAAVISRPNRG